MSNRRTNTDFPRNEAGLVDEFIGTAYDTVKKVYDNLDEIKRLDVVLEDIDHVAEDTINKVIEETIPPIVEEMNQEVLKAQQWAEGVGPDPERPEAKSSKQWADEAQHATEFGKQVIDSAVATGKGELDASIQNMNDILVLVENAKDSALLSGGIFETVQLGLAATAVDGYFSVPSAHGSEYLILYQNQAGVAVEIDVYPSASAVQAVTELIEGTAGDAILFSDSNRFVLMKLLIDGTLDMLMSKLRNTTDGLTVSDRAGFVSGYLRSNESNLHGLIIRPTTLMGIYFTDEYGFVVGKMSPNGAFFGQSNSTVIPDPVKTPIIPQLGQQQRTDHKQIIVYGQSLSVGVNAQPAISLVQDYNNLMVASGVRVKAGASTYDATAYVPLVESNDSGNQGETPAAGICNGVTRRAVESGENPDRWVMLGMSPGVSGNSVEQLSPLPRGTGTYEKVLTQIEDCNSLSKSLGKSYSVWAYAWFQGESNYSPTWETSPYQYAEYQLKLFDSMSDEICLITEQEFRPYMVTYQVAAHRRYSRDDMPIALTQWRLSRAREDVVIGAPCYIFETGLDNLHLTNESSWLMGEYISRAIHQTMIHRGNKWRPLEPILVDWQSEHLDVKFHVPMGKLVLDDALANFSLTMGFDVREDGIPVDVITSVNVLTDDTVRISLNRPTSVNSVLTYARGRPGDPAHSGPVSGARGNLRDSHGDFDIVVSPTGATHALHNACVMFEYSRKTGF